MLAPAGPPRCDLVVTLREMSRPVLTVMSEKYGASHMPGNETYYRWDVSYRRITVATIHATVYSSGEGHAQLISDESIDYLPTFYRQQLVDFQEFLQGDAQ